MENITTIRLDPDTISLLKNIKLRPDESLASVIGRLAVYCYDWEPVNEATIKKLTEINKEECIQVPKGMTLLEFMDSNFCEDCDDECCADGCDCCEIKGLCPDCEVEDDSPGFYVPFNPEIIPEVNKLMAEQPIDMPAGMSFDEFIKSIPESDDNPIVTFDKNILELFEGFHQGEPIIDIIRAQATYFPDKEEILSYGSIHEIQRMLREDGIPVGSFKTVEEFNEHLKYLPKEKILF